MVDLFSHRYPDTAGHNARSTSAEAAQVIDDTGNRDKQLAFLEKCLKDAGPDGLTSQEARVLFVENGFPKVERSQASARLSDACSANPAFAIATERERRSSVSGRNQMVVVHRKHATPEEISKSITFKASKREALKENLETVANFLDALVSSKAIQEGIFSRRAQQLAQVMRDDIKSLGERP